VSFLRQEMIDEIKLRLGAGLIDVELDPEHYETAVKLAIRYYRQRSTNSLIRAFVFLQVQPDVQTYTLPQEIQEIREVLRNNLGGSGMAGAYFDPFGASFTNNIYMIQNPGGLGTGGAGILATYDLAVGFQKLTARMFGREVQYVWDSANKKITFHRRFLSPEEIGLDLYMVRDEDTLLKDHYSRPWIEDMATAQAKLMLGQGRGKFASLAGPQGGITLNGGELKQEATAEIAILLEELKNGIEGSSGYGFTIG